MFIGSPIISGTILGTRSIAVRKTAKSSCPNGAYMGVGWRAENEHTG